MSCSINECIYDQQYRNHTPNPHLENFASFVVIIMRFLTQIGLHKTNIFKYLIIR